jgi:ribose-phosphate pyrophosphokinase
MIKINGVKINVESFPDGTQRIMDFNENLIHVGYENTTPHYEIVWLYESDAEMFTLMCLVNHIRDNHWYGTETRIHLTLPYVPNARMDRTYSIKEVFTLKHFANFINSLNFDKVIVFDVHSNVSSAIINRIHHLKYVSYLVEHAMDIIDDDDNLTIYFPDEGAYKRYSNLLGIEDFPKLYGKKVRDWNTGKISHIDIYNEYNEKASENEIRHRKVLMIDDIISYGGTMAYSADKLKEMGAVKIYAYASHTENSILDKEKGTFLNRLNDNIISGLFTTNSIYNGSHPKIRVIHEF